MIANQKKLFYYPILVLLISLHAPAHGADNSGSIGVFPNGSGKVEIEMTGPDRVRLIALSYPLLIGAVVAYIGPVLSADFVSDSGGFVYADDTFRGTNQPAYASGDWLADGGYSDGGLHVAIGGVDGDDVDDGMSGGWSHPFTVSGDDMVRVTLRYRLVVGGDYEPDECGEALMAIDGNLVSPGAQQYLARYCGLGDGNPNQDSGWQQVSFDLPLSDGSHSLTVGGYNNQKTYATEQTDVYFDDILIEQLGQAPPATETDCADGIDNDLDGLVDCADEDCAAIGSCEVGRELSCADSLDNDGDGLVDCADGDCTGIGGCDEIIAFTDITNQTNTGGPSIYGGHGVQFADVTNTGFPDFYVTMIIDGETEEADLFYRNVDGSQFVEEAALRGIDNYDPGSHGGVWADLDNDGDLDLFNGSWIRNRIYQNDGSGNFADVTDSSGTPDRAWETRGVLAFDMDNDGDLDLFSVTGSGGSDDPSSERNEVYRNEGNMQFSAVDEGDLFSAPAGQGVTGSDIDGDGDIDVIAANRGGDVNILLNDGSGNFVLVPPASLGISHDANDGITVADVNNDGLLDILFDDNLYINNGGSSFTFKNSFSAPGYMGGFADLDNDADWDLVFAGDDRVYLNDGAGNFSASPSFSVGDIDDPRSVAFADIDQDGDIDFFYAQKATFNVLIRNDYVGQNRWLNIRLIRSNGQLGGYGSKVYIYEAGHIGEPGYLLSMREARSQEGYLGQNDPTLHFGVGNRSAVDVRVVFFGGTVVNSLNVTSSQTITVTEGPACSNGTDDDGDGDVDGKDLAAYMLDGAGISVADLAVDFGKTDCP